MASLTLLRHHPLFLESPQAGRTRGYASCAHREHALPRASPQHAPPRAAGGLLVLQRRSHPSARCAWGVVSRALLLWSLSCKTTSIALISRTLHQLNTRQGAHHTFDQAQHCNAIADCLWLTLFLQCRFGVVYHSADSSGTSNTTTVRGGCRRTPRSG